MLETICTRLAEYTDADPESKEIISYGLESLLSTLINATLLLILAAAFHRLPEMVVYMVAFSVLRVSAGGHHARNHILCFLEYALLSMTGILLPSYLAVNPAIYIPAAYLVTAVLIFLFAPKSHPNRPVCKEEYLRFKKRSRITVIAYLPALALMFFLSSHLATVAVTGMLVQAVLIINLKKGEDYYEIQSDSIEYD